MKGIGSSIKQILRDVKSYLIFLQYKKSLPKNPMHDDIYLVEFPKSGVTWLQHILGNIELQLVGREYQFISFYNFHKYCPDVHQLRNSNINRFLNRTFIKSHSKYNPYYFFVVYLIRNPFDVMVSYYNFMRNFGYRKNFETFVKDKRYGIYAWKKHINSWHHNRPEAQRIHFIKYEDLLKNPKTEIKNLYYNIGMDLSSEIIDKALSCSNLEKMRKSELHYKKYNFNYNRNFIGKRNKIPKQKLLTNEIKEFIIEKCYKELKQYYPETIQKEKNKNNEIS